MRFRLGYNRVHGVKRALNQRAMSARAAARFVEERGEALLAASLRGKAKAYDEAAHMVEALEHNRRLPARSRSAVIAPQRVTWPEGADQ